jgi:CHAT domain-containing protein/Tfp pilus assembly protein PilF
MKFYTTIFSIFFLLAFNNALQSQDLDSLRALNWSEERIIEFLESQLNNQPKTEKSIFSLNAKLGDALSKNEAFDEAIVALNKAILLGEKLKLQQQPIFMDAVNDLAFSLIQKGELKAAEKHIRKYIGNDIQDWRYVKLCFFYAECLEKLGDINLAQLHLEKALRISDEIENERYISRALARLSRMYLLNNSYQKAVELDKKLPSYNYLERMDQIMVVKFNIATIYMNNGFLQPAIQIFDAVINWGKANQESEFVLMGNINKASCLRDLKDYTAAKNLYHKAIEIDATREIIYNNLAEVFLITGQPDSAIYYNELALKTSNIDLNHYQFDTQFKNQLFKVPNKEHLLLIFHDLARSQMAYYIRAKKPTSLKKADALFKLLDEMINEIRYSTTEQQSQHFWRNEVKPIYDDAILSAYTANDIEQVFYYAEKSKAILLLDDLLKNTTISKGQIPEQLLERELKIKKQLFDLEMQFSETTEKKQKDALNDLMLKKKLELTNLIQEIETLSPQYVNTRYQPPVSQLAQVQSKLKSDETILNFIWTNDHVFRLVISKNDASIKKIDINDSFAGNLKQLIANLKKSISKKETFKEVNQQLNLVYKKLMGDIELKTKHLIVLPDGLICFLPFEALVVNSDFSNPKYLLEKHTISYGFSVNTTFAAYNQKVKKNLVAFAPNRYAAEMKLSDLNFSEFELAPLLKWGGKVYQNNEANKVAVLNEMAKGSIIHIYSHAEASDSTYPWIAAQDEFIYLPEIYNFRNQADLVVLSACETNLGKEVKGEGVISLARGFFHSGAKSVLASIWKVNDKSNSEIVNQFYQFCKKGHSKAEALRLSKLEYIKSHAIESQSPYYWAGLLYIGRDGDLPISRGITPLTWLFIGLGFLLVAGLIYVVRRKHSNTFSSYPRPHK